MNELYYHYKGVTYDNLESAIASINGAYACICIMDIEGNRLDHIGLSGRSVTPLEDMEKIEKYTSNDRIWKRVIMEAKLSGRINHRGQVYQSDLKAVYRRVVNELAISEVQVTPKPLLWDS